MYLCDNAWEGNTEKPQSLVHGQGYSYPVSAKNATSKVFNYESLPSGRCGPRETPKRYNDWDASSSAGSYAVEKTKKAFNNPEEQCSTSAEKKKKTKFGQKFHFNLFPCRYGISKNFKGKGSLADFTEECLKEARLQFIPEVDESLISETHKHTV